MTQEQENRIMEELRALKSEVQDKGHFFVLILLFIAACNTCQLKERVDNIQKTVQERTP